MQYFATGCRLFKPGRESYGFGMGGRIGLVILSSVLVTFCFGIVWRCVKGWGRVWRVVFALGVFWGFLWLSPQVYYAYFWMIFENLPVQIVVRTPPGVGEVARLLSFTGKASLAQQGQGVFGWLLIATALLRGRGLRI